MRSARAFTTITKNMTYNPVYIIQDSGFPACATCKHFIPYKSPNLHSFKEVDIRYSKCKMFGFKDRISGEIINHFADACRNSTSMCDKNGFYHEPK